MPESVPIIERRAVEPFFKNGYLVACPETLKGIYIDPGDEAEALLKVFEEKKVELIAIVNTHAHLDHISGIRKVREVWKKAPIYLHDNDRPLYFALQTQSMAFGLNYPPAPPVDHSLPDGAVVAVGNLRIRVYHTPGHSAGHVVLHLGKHLFCGDTVFAGSIGRTDLPGTSYPMLIDSIRRRILTLPGETILHPGHGPDSTVERERTTNPFLVSAS